MVSEVNVPSFGERKRSMQLTSPPPHTHTHTHTHTQGRVFLTALPLYQLTRAH